MFKSRVIVKTETGYVGYNSGKNYRTLEQARKNMRTTIKGFKKAGMKVVKAGVLDIDKLLRLKGER